MSNKGLRKIFLSIILPSIAAIILFIVSIYVVIIPSLEKNMMTGKKEMIKELTNTSWSLVQEYYDEYSDSLITFEEAQKLAKERVSKIRYGQNYKDYFWITDMNPVMIMHPYRSELNNTNLKDYKDPQGKKLFVEAVTLVKQSGEGYFKYMWQWKDDSTKIVDKLSYVKGFEPWNWVIGTGIYLEDVKEDIASMERKLLRTSFAITLFIILILIYIIRQSALIEDKRSKAEKDLIVSKDKYKSLVDASTEGTLMLIDQKIIFANRRFIKMLSCSASELLNKTFNEIFKIHWDKVAQLFIDPDKSITIETTLLCNDKPVQDVVISVSKIEINDQEGYIVVVKDVSKQKKIEKANENLSQELQTSLMLMNQPIKHFIKPLIKCDINSTVLDAAGLMSKKNQNILFVSQDNDIIGVLNDSDIRQRVVAVGSELNLKVSQVMTSPVKSIQNTVLLYEAMLIFNTENISHLAVKDNFGNIIGVVSNEDILNLQRNSLSYILKEIKGSESSDQLRKIYERVPVLVKALLSSGAKTQNITRIISSVADAISVRLIELAIEEYGAPPFNFAFVALGSEGRMEQTLATDQDNAIIIENLDGENLEQAKEYFLKLAQRVNKNLDFIGYNYCKGNVMAKNPKYCQPLDSWKEYFKNWIVNSDPQSLIDASIFFDYKCIYGDEKLVEDLRIHIASLVQKHPAFLYHLALTTINLKAPGSIKLFDVKEVLLPFVGFSKTYCIQQNIMETNTIERLNKILSYEIINQQMYDELMLSYDFLMLMRFRFQVEALVNNETPNNEISGDNLTDIEKTTLKKIFSELSSLQTKLSFDFKGSA